MPVVRVHALEIERALDHAGQNLVVGQVGGEASQRVEIGLRHLLLDLVPMRRALFQIVGLEADDLERMLRSRHRRP